MVRRWVCGVVVVAMVFSSLGWSVSAMAKQPSDYYGAEFLYAEGGAILLGTVGFVAAFAVHHGTPLGFWGWGISRAFGATIGVAMAGENYGVEGNVLLGFLLSGVWISISPLVSVISTGTVDFNEAEFELLALPFVPAVLAVIGYNIGAKMKDTGQPASLPWSLDLPVLSLEF